MRKVCVLFAACAIAAATGQSLAQQPSAHLQAERYVWSTGVDRTTRQFRNPVSPPVRPGPLFIWLTVHGDDEALKWMRQDPSGAIPVYVIWMRRGLDGYYSDRADVVELSVGNKDTVGLLAMQLEQEGTFSWRVWSGKSFARSGNWRVRIIDRWGGYLMCRAEGGGIAECDLEIEVAE